MLLILPIIGTFSGHPKDFQLTPSHHTLAPCHWVPTNLLAVFDVEGVKESDRVTEAPSKRLAPSCCIRTALVELQIFPLLATNTVASEHLKPRVQTHKQADRTPVPSTVFKLGPAH